MKKRRFLLKHVANGDFCQLIGCEQGFKFVRQKI